MQKNNFILPHEIFYAYLHTIEGIKFTRREIDTITYLLSGRSAKSIASLLELSPKTVETHIRNVMMKLEANSKEQIITFIEKSDKFSILKKYYSSLLTQNYFENGLKKISELIPTGTPVCRIVYWKEYEQKGSYVHQIESHLKFCGIKTFIDTREGHEFLPDALEASLTDYVFYFIPKKFANDVHEVPQLIQAGVENPCRIIFLLPERKTGLDTQKRGDINYIDFEEHESYYFLFFELIKTILPNIDISRMVGEFKKYCQSTESFSEIKNNLSIDRKGNKNINVLLNNKYYSLFVLLVFFMVYIAFSFFPWHMLKTEIRTPNQNQEDNEKSIIRSDLIIPNEAVLLGRPELMSQIAEGFKIQHAIQTIALTGIGGSGKTTIARHYAHKQKATVIWEINAETRESLRRSFEALAQALSTEEEQKVLRAIQDLKTVSEREEKIIQFVKQHLRSYPHWLLLYDNVEKFSDIQKFFPQDMGTWGSGKVILTTRDSHILTNSHVNHAIPVGELNSEQRLKLYLGIMKTGKNQQTAENKQELKAFLEKIPPFPLDISMAAYYMKATNISYDQYLDRLVDQNKDFLRVQENLLQEGANYNNSRYNLISLSLNNIVSAHKEFLDLILLITLLDSQNIPRELLDSFKHKEVVDSFIYTLKTYSLITNNSSSSPLGPTFSVHRSTQALSLTYLKKYLNLEKNKSSIERSANFLANYARQVLESGEFMRTKFLVNQLEAFLRHENLLTDMMRTSIRGELGCMYYRIKSYARATELLEGCLYALNKKNMKDSRLARTLLYLGSIYQELGDYKKSKNRLEQSLRLYQKSIVEGHYVGEARVLVSLGGVYRYLGNYKKASKILERSYSIYVSEQHVGAILALINLGIAQGDLGNYERARNILEKTLLPYEKKQFSAHCMSVAWILTELGNVYKNLGEYRKAKNLIEQALKIYNTHFLEDHLVVVWALTYLGAAHLELGSYQKAKVILEKSLTIHRKNLGEDHIKIAWTSLYLGRAYLGLNNFQQAQELLERSLKLYERNYGKNHIETARVLQAFGELSLSKEEITAAKDYFLASLKIFLTHQHPDTFMLFENLAGISIQALHKSNTHQFHKLKAQAAHYLKKALEIVKKHFPEDSPHSVRIRTKLEKLEQA